MPVWHGLDQSRSDSTNLGRKALPLGALLESHLSSYDEDPSSTRAYFALTTVVAVLGREDAILRKRSLVRPDVANEWYTFRYFGRKIRGLGLRRQSAPRKAQHNEHRNEHFLTPRGWTEHTFVFRAM